MPTNFSLNDFTARTAESEGIACGKGKYNESHIGTVEDTEHNVCKELLA